METVFQEWKIELMNDNNVSHTTNENDVDIILIQTNSVPSLDSLMFALSLCLNEPSLYNLSEWRVFRASLMSVSVFYVLLGSPISL